MFKKLINVVIGVILLMIIIYGEVFIAPPTYIAKLCIVTIIIFISILISLYSIKFYKKNNSEISFNYNIENHLLDCEDDILEDITSMNSFGSRVTGSKGHKDYVSWLKDKINNLGLQIHENVYTFDRWNAKSSSIIIEGEKSDVSSEFPYSGITGEKGVTGELKYCNVGKYDNAYNKIVVIEINSSKSIPKGLIMNKIGSYPKGNNIIQNDGDLFLSSIINNPKLKEAKESGAKAVIIVWKGVSAEKVQGQYLPFTEEYAGIPALWVNEKIGNKIISSAKKGKAATVILEAEVEYETKSESFYVLIPGKTRDESIIINTHTDGVNVIEENGSVGMLSMIRYFLHTQPNRTLVFTFVTGHLRLSDFKGSSQATSKWMMDNLNLWNGDPTSLKAVAGITVEHLGSMEWKDDITKRYSPTGEIQTEYTYVSNPMMKAIWMEALKDRKLTRSVLLRGHNKIEFGESQPLFEAGLPIIGLVPTPDYLMVESKSMEIEKFNIQLMREQIISLIKATIIIDSLDTEMLGKANNYSFLLGRIR